MQVSWPTTLTYAATRASGNGVVGRGGSDEVRKGGAGRERVGDGGGGGYD